ncbi:MAG: glycosyl transferase family 39, partial [Verrucomicrobia bacterium]|nr:glycosyl transferase family 39 [Verrucomicrobiota bacterium]
MIGTEPKGSWWLPLLAVVVLFTLLGSRGLNEPDEGRYAEIGREMAVSGDWLVPHLNGFEHFQKPPLLYWLTALSMRLLGPNEWAARLPPAFAALGTVLLTAWIGTTLFGRREGYLAGLILLSSGGFFILARLLTPDMLMTFWITAAL